MFLSCFVSCFEGSKVWLRNHKKVGFTFMQVNRNTGELCACIPWEHKTNAVHSIEYTEEGVVQHLKSMENS